MNAGNAIPKIQMPQAIPLSGHKATYAAGAASAIARDTVEEIPSSLHPVITSASNDSRNIAGSSRSDDWVTPTASTTSAVSRSTGTSRRAQMA